MSNKKYKFLSVINDGLALLAERQFKTQRNKMAAFRECYSTLYIRSLAPNAPLVALTATATKLNRDCERGKCGEN